jgi:hypothetical protein
VATTGGGDDDGEGGDDGGSGGRRPVRQRGNKGKRTGGNRQPPLESGEGPVGMLGGGGLARECRSTVGCLHLDHLYPIGRRLDGLWQGLLAAERHSRSLCQRARAPHAYFAAPVRGRRAA